MINFIVDTNENPLDFTFPNRYIGPLSHINLLVGANNSGKSRFMRYIIKNNIPLFSKPADFANINPIAKQFRSSLTNIIDKNIDAVDFCSKVQSFNRFNQALSDISLWKNDLYLQFLNYLIGFLNWPEQLIRTYQASARNTTLSNCPQNIALESALRQLALNALHSLSKQKKQTSILYFPILRTLRTLNSITSTSEDIFKNKITDDYFKDFRDTTLYIHTGLSYYDDIQNLLLGNLIERTIIRDVELFLSTNFFDDQPIALIPKLSDKVLHIKIGDEKEQPIHNLGDGLQTLILLTLPLLKEPEKEKLVFIEEPELFLHPGMQRKLLQVLSTFENYQFFITTHSNHLLDISLEMDDLSIFTFTKTLPDNNESEKLPVIHVEQVYGNDDSPLNLLEVRKSSVFLSNCTIWVEGATDRLYLRRYLDIIKKEYDLSDQYREDLHYSFIEYGGNNITHFNFDDDISEEQKINIKRLCGKSFLIVDQDGGNKETRHQELSEMLNDRFYALQCREIENLLTPNVLKSIVAEYENRVETDIEFKTKITQGTYRKNLLGKFLENNINNLNRRGGYADSSGTIKRKLHFCEKALKYINKKDDMSEEAIALAEKILTFIKENNPS